MARSSAATGERSAEQPHAIAVACLVLAVVATAAANTSPVESDEAALWGDVSRLEVQSAYRAFGEARPGASAHDDAWDFGRALTALSVQPRLISRVDEAESLLQGVASRGGTLAPLAIYFLGRIVQIHRDPPDLSKARNHFETLLAAHGGTLAADMAANKLAMLLLIQLPGCNADRAAALPEAEALLGRVARPDLRFSLHLVIANASLYYDLGHEVALRHLLAAIDLGTPTILLRRQLLIRAVTAAARQGNREVVAVMAAHYLDEFPRGAEAGYITRMRDQHRQDGTEATKP